ncbi:PAS domain S-box protein [bacterium SCSIO 12643]|nr:PAS domain S-box protein [bacterium SCSIO 12643]
MSKTEDLLKRKIERERLARREAEKILELKSFELYEANQALKQLNASLEDQVEERSRQLEINEARFKSIVETASDLIYRLNAEGYFTYANPVTLKKTGYTIEEIKKKHFTELILSGHQESMSKFYYKQWEEKIVDTYKEFPVISKTGELFWLGQNVMMQFDEKGDVLQVNAVARDITDAKISQTRLNNLIKNLHTAVLLEDEQSRSVIVNEAFCELFGIAKSPTELIGKMGFNLLSQVKGAFESEKEYEDRIQELLTDKKLVIDEELELKDGRIIERSFIPIYVENYYSGHMWNYVDVTKQRKYLKNLQRSEEKYQRIITNMNLGLMEVDTEGIVQYVNRSFSKMSGYELSEILGKSSTEILLDEENMPIIDSKIESRKTGVSDTYEVAVRNKEGDERWWLISGAPLYNEVGAVSGSIGIHLDLTEHKNLEKELIESKLETERTAKIKEVFLANMSHEIRTPMNGIIGMTRMLFRTDLSDKQKFYLDIIKSASDNLVVILNDILDLSKIEAGKFTIEKEAFDFSKMLHHARHVMLPKAEESDLEIEVIVAPEINASFFGDSHRITQVLLNLIGNSIKFTPEGVIKIKADLIGNTVDRQLISIAVIDEGYGMDKEFLDKIFEKFTQEGSSTARKFGGTGLGMNICKELVELMDGNIAVESEKGKGTTVTIQLPLELHEGIINTKVEEIDANSVNHLKDKRILIAEDNSMNQMVVEATLEPYEMNLTFVENGAEAIDILQTEEFDLVLMDVQMPVMDGLQATQIIRDRLKMDIPIIALTANVIEGDERKYLNSGMNDFVPKPFEEYQIIGKLSLWLGVDLELEPEKMDSADGLYSMDKLEQISRGSDAFIKKVVGIFIKETELTTGQFKEALEQHDFPEIKKVAHKMKPVIDQLSISSLTDEIRELEKWAEKGENVDRITTIIEKYCEVMNLISEDFQQKKMN